MHLKENLLSNIADRLKIWNDNYNRIVYGFLDSVFDINPEEQNLPRPIERELERVEEPKDISDETLELFSYASALRDFEPDFSHLRTIIKEAKKRRIEPSLALAIVTRESSFRENAINRNRNGTYDYGYFQLNNRWHDQHRNNAEKHIETGLDHLEWCINTENNNITKALIRYNTGHPDNSFGARYASSVLRMQRDIESEFTRNLRQQRRVLRNLT